MFKVTVSVERSRAYTRMILAGIVRYSKINGPWQLYGQPRHFVRPMPDPRTWIGDGAIAMCATPQIRDEYRSVPYPVVNVSAMRRDVALPTVVPDNIAVGRIAAKHLLDRGFRRFAFFGPISHGYAFDRRVGVLEMLSTLGLTCDSFEPEYGPDGNWEQMIEHIVLALKRLTLPIAIIAANDEAAMVLLDAIHHGELRCPEDVAVVGADNDSLAGELSVPSLSSVDVNAFQVGYRAAELLDTLMRGQAAPTSPILIPPAGVVARQSSDMLSLDDPLLRRAVAFIRQSFRTGISVEQVAEHADCSRRALELRFKQHLNRSPADEIRRVQIDTAKQLLIETDLPLDDVAERAGLGSLRQLAIVFRKNVGTSPSDFRRQRQRIAHIN